MFLPWGPKGSQSAPVYYHRFLDCYTWHIYSSYCRIPWTFFTICEPYCQSNFSSIKYFPRSSKWSPKMRIYTLDPLLVCMAFIYSKYQAQDVRFFQDQFVQCTFLSWPPLFETTQSLELVPFPHNP